MLLESHPSSPSILFVQTFVKVISISLSTCANTVGGYLVGIVVGFDADLLDASLRTYRQLMKTSGSP